MLVLPSFLGFPLVFFRGDRSFRPEPLRISRLEDIEFLDDIHIKKQNMRFKSLTNDQTVLRYRYFNFYTRHKVVGKGFSSQMPTLKTVPSDQKSNRRTCAEECQMPFKRDEAQATRRQCAVFRFTPAAHINLAIPYLEC